MKLIGHPHSSCTRKVRMTLAEKGQSADFETVDLFTGEHKGAAHRARQPFGVIPVLEDDGFVLYESRAIVRYLDARFPTPALTPAAPRDAARMAQWMSVDQSYVAPHTAALARERLVKKHAGEAPDPAIERAAETALGAALAIIDRALASSEYLAGPFSLADISLAPYVASLPMIGAAHLTADLRHLGAWAARVHGRPSWKQATGQ